MLISTDIKTILASVRTQASLKSEAASVAQVSSAGDPLHKSPSHTEVTISNSLICEYNDNYIICQETKILMGGLLDHD